MITTPLADAVLSLGAEAWAQAAEAVQYLAGFGMGAWLYRILRARPRG